MAASADLSTLIGAARQGDRRALARLISLVERGGDEGRQVLALVFPATGNAHIVGITGPPGAGKSTLTDGLIEQARLGGHEVGVLLVDPSSPFTGGALLGDRVRMQDRVSDPGVFIRSMASRGHLGGISEATPRAAAVLDGTGSPFVLIETVGVGQAEVNIAENADTTVVVLNPGWGDSIQAAKAGLLEIGDVFVVNKADKDGLEATVTDLEQMLHQGPQRPWQPAVLKTVATEGSGVAEVWENILEHRRHLVDTSELGRSRKQRLERDLLQALQGLLERRAVRSMDGDRFEEILGDVVERRLDPWSAAERLLA